MNEIKKEVWWEVPERDVLLKTLLTMPQKIMNNHESDNLAQLVLHELGHDFWLKRATYLIDNPDFDCLKGVAGYYHDECASHQKNIWDNPQDFGTDMANAQFHSLIKDFSHSSSFKRKNGSHNHGELSELGVSLGMTKPHSYVWDLRHGNQGILLFECLPDCKLQNKNTDLIDGVSALLGLCTV